MDAKARSFADVRAAMQRYVDQDILAGVSWTFCAAAISSISRCVGFADRDAKTALRADHIFRAFSNTRIFVTCSIMLLAEQAASPRRHDRKVPAAARRSRGSEG